MTEKGLQITKSRHQRVKKGNKAKGKKGKKLQSLLLLLQGNQRVRDAKKSSNSSACFVNACENPFYHTSCAHDLSPSLFADNEILVRLHCHWSAIFFKKCFHGKLGKKVKKHRCSVNDVFSSDQRACES